MEFFSAVVFAYGSKAVRAFLRFSTFVVDCKLT